MGIMSVVKVLDEHERTMAFAEVALGQIRSLRQTAIPRNYEIWYVYATGYNAPLNKIINETLARNGKLTEADLEQIYDTYLSHIKTTDRIDKVGARVIGEIDDVMTLISEALALRKPLFAVPYAGSFEQILNGRYLDREGYGTWATSLTDEGLGRFLEHLGPMRERLAQMPSGNESFFEDLDRLLEAL